MIEKIHVDDRYPAILSYDGKSVSCPTLQEAVLEWQRLPPDQREIASIKSNGASYTADEIDRLYRRHDQSAT